MTIFGNLALFVMIRRFFASSSRNVKPLQASAVQAEFVSKCHSDPMRPARNLLRRFSHARQQWEQIPHRCAVRDDTIERAVSSRGIGKDITALKHS
jgi:hypothetical protein